MGIIEKCKETREATYTCRYTSGHLIPKSVHFLYIMIMFQQAKLIGDNIQYTTEKIVTLDRLHISLGLFHNDLLAPKKLSAKLFFLV